MSAFFTGLFTLIAALGGIWLKDYLADRKNHKNTIKQKALEAFFLADSLMVSFNSRFAICKMLINKPSLDWLKLENTMPFTTYEELKTLEFLIIENFYQLNTFFFKIKKLINEQNMIMVTIIFNATNNEENMSIKDLEKSYANFIDEILPLINSLTQAINKNFINKEKDKFNIYLFANKIIREVKSSFFKPE